jgi:hypothetical protein
MTLEEITEAVLAISPQVLDAREAAALVESCGVNDSVANADFGLADTFAVGRHIFLFSQTNQRVASDKTCSRSSIVAQDARQAAHKFSLNFAYALPWTVLLVVEYLKPKLLQLSPEWGGVLSLSVIASLISAGGFSQAIARVGYFYLGIKEPTVALRLCLLFVKWGFRVCCGLAIAGLLLAHYLQLFPVSYLILGMFNSVVLSALWMFCSMLSVQTRVWRIPLVFLLGGLTFALLPPDFGVVGRMLIANLVSLGCAAAFSILEFRRLCGSNPPSVIVAGVPRMSVVIFMLLPFFLYGFTYFAFLFADRIAAGSAVPWASGLSFGIDSQYKKGMDVALFIFLVLAAVVEYAADKFMREWFDLAEQRGHDNRTLRSRYYKSLRVVCYFFVVLSAGLGLASHHLERGILVTAVLGCIGYFFTALALFNLILLFSVNRPERALALVFVALVCNFGTGYLLSHIIGVEFSAVGLVVGGLVLFLLSHRVVRVVMREADYFYALA